MGILFDVILVAVAALFLIRGWKKGAVKTLISFLGTIAAVVAAFTVGFMLADTVYQIFFENRLLKALSDALANSVGVPLTEQINVLWEQLPQWLAGLLQSSVSADRLQEILVTDSADTAQLLLDSVIRPVVIALLRVILTLILLVVFQLLVKLLAKTGDKIASLPLLTQINSVAGILIGAVKGAFMILLALAVIRMVVPAQEQPKIFTEENIAASFVFEAVYENNPLYSLFQPVE